MLRVVTIRVSYGTSVSMYRTKGPEAPVSLLPSGGEDRVQAVVLNELRTVVEFEHQRTDAIRQVLRHEHTICADPPCVVLDVRDRLLNGESLDLGTITQESRRRIDGDGLNLLLGLGLGHVRLLRLYSSGICLPLMRLI